MYRILIAEDEKIVRDSYKDIIAKNIKNVEVHTVRSGLEAIESVMKDSPDIILMDINMPGIKGLDAIKEIKRKSTNIVFVVISAYDDFNFAQEAISLDVFEYIVKPILRDILLDVVKRSIDKVDEKRNSIVSDIKSREMAERVLPALEHNFIYSLIMNAHYMEELELYSDIFDFNEIGGHIVVLEFLSGEKSKDKNKEIAGYVNAINNFIHHIKKGLKCIASTLMGSKVILFLPSNEDRTNIIDETMKQILSKYDKDTYIYGIGGFREIAELNLSYKEALRTIIFGKKEERVNSSQYESELFEKSEMLIRNCLKGKKQESQAKLTEIIEYITIKEIDTELEWLKEKITEIFAAIFYKNENEAKNKGIRKIKGGYIREINMQKSIEEIHNWAISKIDEICNSVSISRMDINETIVEITKYIDENYTSDITLEDVAGQFFITPQYLSKLFKENTGKNFSEYIISMRLTKAKELLDTTNMSIKDISYNIGYNDPNYFSRLFKKEMGISPSEYVK